MVVRMAVMEVQAEMTARVGYQALAMSAMMARQMMALEALIVLAPLAQ
jgi:hypothetical protein